MSVYKKLDKVTEYIGDSTDDKPTNLLGVGHTFVELNTGQKWLWDGAQWVEDLTLIHAIMEANSNL